jgi:putative lipoic acid-binding regulatory protein
LARPSLIAPATNATMQFPQSFTFNSVGSIYDITVEYVIQVSSTLNFAPGTYIQNTLFQRRDTGTLASDPIDLNDTALPSSIRNASTVYWRIGAKNVVDNPGPRPDSLTGKRYIFSVVNQLRRPAGPPPPPSN